MSETGKVYQVQYPATVAGKVYNVRDVSGDSSVSGKVYQVANISGGGGGGGGASTDWWDIKKILDEDTRDYAGKVGVIMYNFNDVSDFQLSSSGMAAVATSDGAFYTYADNGSKVSHNWDTSKDKDDGRGFKTRWVIYYYTTDTTGDGFGSDVKKFGWADNFIAYLALRINCYEPKDFCYGHKLLEAIDNVGYVVSATSFFRFCQLCSSLRKLPDCLDTSNGADFSQFCVGCSSLTRLPDWLDTSNGTSFYRFCDDCEVLQTVPEITFAGNTDSFASYSYPFMNCAFLKTAFITLPSNTNFWLSSSTRISIESFRYIADHAPDVTATPRTLTVGSTNISRINAADPTIITDLNAKGWTVA